MVVRRGLPSMTRLPRVIRPLFCIAVISAACGGSGGGPAAPVSPTSPSPAEGVATFILRGAGYDNQLAYPGANGVVFCRPQTVSGRRYLWVRAAATQAADGANGPHMDLDFCGEASLGTHSFDRPHDPQGALACGPERTWDIWWHDGPRAFVSVANAGSCTATLTVTATRVDGRFECRGLVPAPMGNERLDVLAGSFSCRLP